MAGVRRRIEGGERAGVGRERNSSPKIEFEYNEASYDLVTWANMSPKSGYKVKDRFLPSPGRIKFSTIIPDVYITQLCPGL